MRASTAPARSDDALDDREHDAEQQQHDEKGVTAERRQPAAPPAPSAGRARRTGASRLTETRPGSPVSQSRNPRKATVCFESTAGRRGARRQRRLDRRQIRDQRQAASCLPIPMRSTHVTARIECRSPSIRATSDRRPAGRRSTITSGSRVGHDRRGSRESADRRRRRAHWSGAARERHDASAPEIPALRPPTWAAIVGGPCTPWPRAARSRRHLDRRRRLAGRRPATARDSVARLIVSRLDHACRDVRRARPISSAAVSAI